MNKIRKGDKVGVISGKHRGKAAAVSEVITSKSRVRLEGSDLAKVKRHVKSGVDMDMPEGGIKELDVTVHISNVLPIDPSTNKPAKVGFKVEDGKKVRVFKKSGNVLS